MVSLFRKFIPGPAFRLLRSIYKRGSAQFALAACCYNDYKRYRRYFTTDAELCEGERNLQAVIFMDAHSLEKAFSLPAVTPGYGGGRVDRLVGLLGEYSEAGYDMADVSVRKARSVLGQYLEYHREKGVDLGERYEAIERWAEAPGEYGGALRIKRSESAACRLGAFSDLSASRYSVRHYSGEPVPRELMLEAVGLARKTPSVCNRQTWRSYMTDDPETKKRALSLQNGNRGFGDGAAWVVVITSDIRGFVGPTERNQSFVDGGMFAMSLLYAFHFLGLGACPLNWMVEPHVDADLRSVMNIPDSENIIMMVTVGGLPDEYVVARSTRLGVDRLAFFR